MSNITPIYKEMRPRRIDITAPRGHKERAVRALRDAGVTVSRDRRTGREEGYWNPAREDKPVDREAVVALARSGRIRIRPPSEGPGRRNGADRLRPLTESGAARVLSRERLETACRLSRGALVGGVYRVSGDDAVREILRRVGPAGEQARADEARCLETFDEVQYASRNHHGRDWREVSLAVVAADESAAIVCYVEAGSYLHRGASGGLHHLRFAVYLVVRDATSGERHVIRVPPRFGSTRTATWQRYMKPNGDEESDPDGLVHATAAWTFGLRPHEYSPDIES